MNDTGDGQAKSVLIVDDSQVMRNMLAKFFNENGFDVVGMAADGVEAVEMFEKLNPGITVKIKEKPRWP